MAEWKTLESERERQAEEARNRPLLVRVGGWLLRVFWGFVAGNALAILFFYFAVMSTSGKTDTSALAGAIIGLIAFPFIVGGVILVWFAVATLVPFLGGQIVQAVACVAICGFVAVVISTTNPASVRAQRDRDEAALAYERAHPDPKVAAKRAEMERREREEAYGNYVPRAAPAPAPYVPRVEPRKPDDAYSQAPEIHVSRFNGDVRLTNHGTQVLRIAAKLQLDDGQAGTGDARPAATCAELLGPDGSAPGSTLVLAPRQSILLQRREPCAATATAPVQLQVWNDQRQPTPFRLINER